MSLIIVIILVIIVSFFHHANKENKKELIESAISELDDELDKYRDIRNINHITEYTNKIGLIYFSGKSSAIYKDNVFFVEDTKKSQVYLDVSSIDYFYKKYKKESYLFTNKNKMKDTILEDILNNNSALNITENEYKNLKKI